MELTEVRTGEVVDIKGELATVAEGSGVDLGLANKLAEAFVPLAQQAAALIDEARGITVTDATQVTEIRASKAARLKLKAVRVEIDKVRSGLKEEPLRHSQAIDGLARFLRERIEPVEKRLDDQEKYAERKEAERKAALKASREKLLPQYGVDPRFFDLGSMPEEQWANLLESSRVAHEAKLAAAKKAEDDRLAAEAARKAEEERVLAENERLRQERIEADRAAKAERERIEAESLEREATARRERNAAEAEAKRERLAREKLEREAEARKAEEDRKAAAEAKAKRAAERAPDREKIVAIAAAVRALPMPSVKSGEAIAVLANVRNKAEAFAAWIEAQAGELA